MLSLCSKYGVQDALAGGCWWFIFVLDYGVYVRREGRIRKRGEGKKAKEEKKEKEERKEKEENKENESEKEKELFRRSDNARHNFVI